MTTCTPSGTFLAYQASRWVVGTAAFMTAVRIPARDKISLILAVTSCVLV